jgi:hypothetical protein
MIGSHFVNGVVFAEVRTHGFRSSSVLVRSFAGLHNIHSRERKRTGTSVSLGGGGIIRPLWLIRRNNKLERPVEPSLRRAHPFYSDMDRAPFADRIKVELAAIGEVQPRPQHCRSLAPWGSGGRIRLIRGSLSQRVPPASGSGRIVLTDSRAQVCQR